MDVYQQSPVRVYAASVLPLDNHIGGSSHQETRFLQVRDRIFEVHVSILSEGSIALQRVFSSPHSKGRTIDDPIILSGHTPEQFSAFLWAVYARPLPDPTDIPLPSLLSIAEIALKYSFKALKTWAIDGVQTLVTSHDTPLRTAPTEIFIRMLRLSLIYHRPDLGVSIQNKWITRIHWHELPPVPAILMADMHDLQYLLSHALYVHMVNMAPRIAAGKRIDGDSPLTPNQNLHIFCGYNSLAAYWTHLRSEAPAFVAAPKCASHDLCKAAWEQKWFEVMKGPMVYLNVDVLRRLMFVGSVLEEDRFLKVCMKEGCLRSALESVSRKRTDISNNLHHHFDL